MLIVSFLYSFMKIFFINEYFFGENIEKITPKCYYINGENFYNTES